MKQLPDGVIDVRKVKTVIGGEGGRAHLTWVVAYSDRIAPGTPTYETIREFVGTLKPPPNTEQSVMLLPVIAREPVPPPAPAPPPEKPPARTPKKARVRTTSRAKARAKAPPKTRKKSPLKSPLRKPAPRKSTARKPARRATARKPVRRSRR